MSPDLGGRIKLVREAHGLSQTAFAELGGVKKNSQINYEAGRTAPTVDYLSSLAGHGVDVFYVLTGRRRLSPEQAEARMSEIKALFDQAMPAPDAPERAELETIALDESLPDRIRAAADTLIYVAWADPEAGARRKAREARYEAQRRRARLTITDAASNVGWPDLPARLQGPIERLLTTPEPSDDITRLLIEDLLRAIKEG